MTDKEFKRLGRPQLIEIIYQLQLQIDKLTEQNQFLENALEDKRLRISNAGNLAEAVLEINDCFQNAQNAADQYLNEIKAIREETEAEKERILATARAEAEKIVADTKKACGDNHSAIEGKLKEYGQNYLDNWRRACHRKRRRKFLFLRKTKSK